MSRMKTLHEQLCELGLVRIYDYCREYFVTKSITGYSHLMAGSVSHNRMRFYVVRLPNLDNPIVTLSLKEAHMVELNKGM